MTRVIFSDGSKADAHNLDDLRERWILRKQEEARVVGVKWSIPDEPEYVAPHSIEEARESRAILKSLIAMAATRLTELNAISHRERDWMPRRAAQIAEMEYRKCQLRVLNAQFVNLAERESAANNAKRNEDLPGFVNELMQEIRNTHADIKALKRRVEALEKDAFRNTGFRRGRD